jgi:cyclohexyl-isocyanide hydratase
MHDVLNDFGAIAIHKRVVEDRNRITGAGVTAGLDFALTLVMRLRTEKMARSIALAFEYDPSPPFHNGNPQESDLSVLAMMREMYKPLHSDIKKVASKGKYKKRE